MDDVSRRTEIKRVPRQKRSQIRFDAVLNTALRLFAVRGYESVAMREIAREANIPIASVYQYFPTKLAIVREMWTRYTNNISETLAAGINRFLKDSSNDSASLIGIIVDRMAELQASTPAFIEVWSCVAASIELRELDAEDTLKNARLIASVLQKKFPKSSPAALFDRALIAVEMASSTTRFALTLSEPHRARVLLSLKSALHLLLDPSFLNYHLPTQAKESGRRGTGVILNAKSKKATTRNKGSRRTQRTR